MLFSHDLIDGAGANPESLEFSSLLDPRARKVRTESKTS